LLFNSIENVTKDLIFLHQVINFLLFILMWLFFITHYLYLLYHLIQ